MAAAYEAFVSGRGWRGGICDPSERLDFGDNAQNSRMDGDSMWTGGEICCSGHAWEIAIREGVRDVVIARNVGRPRFVFISKNYSFGVVSAGKAIL